MLQKFVLALVTIGTTHFQADAIDSARSMLENQRGGELTVKGLNGRIRSKDTISPGHDPNPPRDTEH